MPITHNLVAIILAKGLILNSVNNENKEIFARGLNVKKVYGSQLLFFGDEYAYRADK
jgi:hypothetical protein